jgi:hypothetical protein
MSTWNWTPDETGMDEDDSPMCPWCGDLIPPTGGHRCMDDTVRRQDAPQEDLT